MSKVIRVIVYDCHGCLFSHWGPKAGRWCEKKKRENMAPAEIPQWCPLPDAEEKGQ